MNVKKEMIYARWSVLTILGHTAAVVDVVSLLMLMEGPAMVRCTSYLPYDCIKKLFHDQLYRPE